MIDYDAMSDGELSLEVGKRVVDGICSYMIHDHKAVFNTRDDEFFIEFDINNPSGMWDIIVKHGINIEFDECAAFQNAYICNEEGYPAFEHGFDTKNRSITPLRAAAICFLKMQEAKE